MYGDNVMSAYVGASDYADISISDCKKFYEEFFSPDHAVVVVGGNIYQTEAMKELAFLGDWEKKGYTVPKPTQFTDMKTSQVFGVDYSNSQNSQITLGFKAMPYDIDGNYYKSRIMNFALGGNFNSRLNLDIREDKAWTYGI